MADKILGADIVINDKGSVAIEKLTKKFTNMEKQIVSIGEQLTRFESKSLSNANRALSQTTKNAEHTERALKKLAKGWTVAIKVKDLATAPIKGIFNSLTSLQGVATMALGGYASQQAISSTWGQALKFDMTRRQIDYLAKNKGMSGNKIMGMAQQTSLTSIFEEKEIYDAYAGFMSYGKNEGQVKKLTDMAQLLAYTDPLQGMQGAKIAMQELLSGDAKSLYMRFEKIPKSIADKLASYSDNNDMTKASSMDGFIKLFNSLMTKTGYDSDYVKAMEQSPYGKWLSSLENVQVTLRKIGEAALPRVTSMIDKFNSKMNNGGIDRIAKVFGKLSESVAKLAEKGLDSLLKNSDKIIDKFDKMFISLSKTIDQLLSGDKKFSDILKEWLTGGVNVLNSWADENQATIQLFAEKLADGIAWSIDSILPKMVEAGAKIASSVVQGLISNPTFMAIAGAGLGAQIGGPIGAIIGLVGGAATGMVGDVIKTNSDIVQRNGNRGSGIDRIKNPTGKIPKTPIPSGYGYSGGTVSINAPITINGTSLSPEQISAALVKGLTNTGNVMATKMQRVGAY